MAYFSPFVDAAGLHIPTYTDLRDYLLEQYQTIYGPSVYLGTDSADYQWISVLSIKIFDAMQSSQLAYNSRSPLTSVGAALDAVVKINGIARKASSFSTCPVTLTGVAGTTISNGVVQDTSGYKWDLPTPVTIGGSGTITVTATCQTAGAINALTGTITKIVTPTAGWTSVTNTSAASLGQPVETDSQLRARQGISTALPSQTMLAGTVAAIKSLSGVTRINPIENPAGVEDDYGTPAHSITMVVEGGTDEDIAAAIFNNRGIGCYTNGTTAVTVTDDETGLSMPIRFSRPDYVPIYVSLNVKSLTGYTTATTAAIKAAIAAYLNSLEIGEALTVSSLYGAALSVMSNLSQPTFSIRALYAGKTSSPTGTTDISIDYDEVTQGNITNVTINLV